MEEGLKGRERKRTGRETQREAQRGTRGPTKRKGALFGHARARAISSLLNPLSNPRRPCLGPLFFVSQCAPRFPARRALLFLAASDDFSFAASARPRPLAAMAATPKFLAGAAPFSLLYPSQFFRLPRTPATLSFFLFFSTPSDPHFFAFFCHLRPLLLAPQTPGAKLHGGRTARTRCSRLSFRSFERETRRRARAHEHADDERWQGCVLRGPSEQGLLATTPTVCVHCTWPV